VNEQHCAHVASVSGEHAAKIEVVINLKEKYDKIKILGMTLTNQN
jgi:hypothetical protein